MAEIDISVVLIAGRSAPALHASLVAARRAAAALPSESRMELLLLADAAAPELPGCVAGCEDLPVIVPQGPADGRCRAIEAARGRYIAFLDAGDLWSGNLLTRAVAASQLKGGEGCVWRPEAVVSCGPDYFAFTVDAIVQQPMPDAAAGSELLHSCRFASSFFAHRAVYERVPFPSADVRRGWLDVDAWWIADCLGAGVAQRILHGAVLYRWNPAQHLPHSVRIGPSTLFAAGAGS